MEWSWPLFVRITRYDLGWSKACVGWHERLHPEQPRPAAAVVSVVAAAVVPAPRTSADGSTKAPGVARVAAVAAKATPVVSKATPVAVVPAPVATAAATAASIAVAAPPAAVATTSAAVATATAKATTTAVTGPAKTSPGLGLPQFLVMLEVPGGQLTAETKPIVRDRTFKCLFEWLKTAPAQVALAEHYDQVEAVLIAGLTDVWSAIRKACAARLLGLEHNLKHPHMMQLYQSCVAICHRADITWQAREGALMGITAIVRRFRIELRDPTDAFTPRRPMHRRTQSGGSLHPDAVLTVDGNDFCSPTLPADVSRTLAVVGFASLADPQLSVREVATKAFAVYLSRSNHRETVKAFGEVIGRLRGGGKPACLQLLGAFEAEGLLSLCAVLVKVLTVDWLHSHWSSYAPTLLTYLGHQASTVRQSASRIFFYVMAKEGGDLGLAQLIIADLTGGWLVPVSPRPGVNREEGAAATAGTFEESLAAANVGAHIWEWKEGRLLAYELVLNGLLNNHTSSIFPTLHSTLSPRTLPSPILLHSPASPGVNYLQPRSTPSVAGSNLSPATPGASPAEEASVITPAGGADGSACAATASLIDRLRKLSPATGKRDSPVARGFSPFRIHKLVPPPPSGGLDPDNGGGSSPLTPNSANSQSSGEFEVGDTSETQHGDEKAQQQGQILTPVPQCQTQLRCILCHTVVCFGDTRWEVRRIAAQVLPALTEVLCWFDVDMLKELWTEMIQSASTLLVLVSLTALRHALRKCQTLRALLPALSAQSGDGNARVRVEAVITGVGALLPELASRIKSLVRSGNVEDGIAILGAEVLMMIHTHWGATPELSGNSHPLLLQNSTECGTQLSAVIEQLVALHQLDGGAAAVPVLSLISSLRTRLHPESPESSDRKRDELGGPQPAQLSIAGQKRGAQYLRSLVTRLVSWLPDFMLTVSFTEAISSLLPLLACWLVKYEEVNIQMSLCEAISRTLNVSLSFISGTTNGALGAQSLKKSSIPRGSQLKPPPFGHRPSPCPPTGSQAAIPKDDSSAGSGVPVPDMSQLQSSSALSAAVHALSDNYETFIDARNDDATAATALPAGQVEQVTEYLVESVLLQLVEQRNLEVPILRRVLDLLVSVCRLVGDGRYVARLQHAIASRMSDSMGEISRFQSPRSRLEAGGPAGISAEGSFSSVASDGSAAVHTEPSDPRSVGQGVRSLAAQERGKERRLSVGVPSPVSVDGFESGGLSGGLADSDEDDVGESGSVSVAGPEKTELAVERAGDWDDWDDWDEEAEDIDDLVLEFGRCITSIRAEFGQHDSRSTNGSSTALATDMQTETSRRQFLGIGKADDALLDSPPLAPDDDIIINWLLEKCSALQAARGSLHGRPAVGTPSQASAATATSATST